MTGPRVYRLNITDAFRRRIKDMVAEGLSHADIAKRFGISKDIVGKIIRGQR